MLKIDILSVLNHEMWTTVQKKFNFFDVIGERFEDLLTQISSLLVEESFVSWIRWEKDSRLLFWDDLWDWLYFWAFCIARWQDIPQKIRRNEELPVNIGLSEDEWIAEITHVLYDKKTRIMMVEYNHYWPRISTIDKHINYFIRNRIFEDYELFAFNIRVNQNILEQLEKFDAIKLFELSVKSINSDEVWKLDDSLYDALNAAKKLWESETIEIILRAWKKWILSNNLNWTLLYKIKELFTRKDTLEISNLCEKLKIRGIKDNHVENLDLLKHVVKFESRVIKVWQEKKIDQDDMKKKMKEWYNENKKLFY